MAGHGDWLKTLHVKRAADPNHGDFQEFAEIPTRYTEDKLNGELADKLPWAVKREELDSPHVKTFILLQVGPRPSHPLAWCLAWARLPLSKPSLIV